MIDSSEDDLEELPEDREVEVRFQGKWYDGTLLGLAGGVEEAEGCKWKVQCDVDAYRRYTYSNRVRRRGRGTKINESAGGKRTVVRRYRLRKIRGVEGGEASEGGQPAAAAQGEGAAAAQVGAMAVVEQVPAAQGGEEGDAAAQAVVAVEQLPAAQGGGVDDAAAQAGVMVAAEHLPAAQSGEGAAAAQLTRPARMIGGRRRREETTGRVSWEATRETKKSRDRRGRKQRIESEDEDDDGKDGGNEAAGNSGQGKRARSVAEEKQSVGGILRDPG